MIDFITSPPFVSLAIICKGGQVTKSIRRRRPGGPWPLLNFKALFAIENHLSLVKWPP